MGATALVSALLTMPVAGTALYIADQHLHPRTPACAAILFAIGAVLDRRYGLAVVFSAAAVLFHPLMGAFGIAYLIVLALPLERWNPKSLDRWPSAVADYFASECGVERGGVDQGLLFPSPVGMV